MAITPQRLRGVFTLTLAIKLGLLSASALQAQTKPTTKPQAPTKTASKAAGPAQAMSDKKSSDPTKELKVVAVVNGMQVSREKLADECLKRYGKDVLDQRIHKQLIFAECQARKIVITEQDVNEEVARMANKFRIPVDKYVELIQNERGVPIEQYRADIIWPTLALRILAEKELEVTPAEIQKQWEMKFGAKVKCSVIVCKTKDHALKARSKCLADPEEFGEIAKKESIDRQSAAVMGSIPPICKHIHEPAIEKAVFALQAGEISEVIPFPSMDQYLVFKCEKHIPQVIVPADATADAKQRIEDEIRDQKSQMAAANICEALKKKAKVRSIYTDEKLAEEQPGIVAMINGAAVTRLALAEDCIARFGKQVLEGEINRTMLEGALKQRKVSVSDEMLDAEMTKAAREAGIVTKDGKPDVEQWLTKAAAEWGITPDLYISDYVWNTCAMKLLVSGKIEVTEQEIQNAFEAHYGVRARVLAIVGSDERRMKEVWNLAMQDPKQDTFGQLAAQYSEETVSKSNLGLIPPIPKHSGRDKLEKAAFKLKKGEISAVVQVDSTYYVILYGMGLTEPIVQKMDAAIRKELTNMIREQKEVEQMTIAYDDLRESAEIMNFLTSESHVGKRVASNPAAEKATAPRAGARTAAPASASKPK